MLNFVICDDKSDIRETLPEICSLIFKERNLDAKVGFCTGNPEDVLDYSSKNQVDVFILDIQLGDGVMDGIDLAKKIREGVHNKKAYIIFMTSYMEKILVAVKLNIFDFLLKPVTDERLAECLSRVYKDSLPETKTLTVKSGSTIKIIDCNEIYYIEKKVMKAEIHLKDSNIITYMSLEEIKKLLPNQFVRCHKSFIINLNMIDSVQIADNFVILKNGSKCDVGAKYKKALIEVV